MSIYYQIGLGIGGFVLVYFLARLTFDVLLRGFAPIIASRPWAINALMAEIDKERVRPNPSIYSLSCGRSGFLLAAGAKFPTARLFGVEHDLLPYLLEKIQLRLRREKRIQITYLKNLYQLDVSSADLIYCYLDIEILRDLPKKLKFECKPGTIILSNGFPIPNLTEKRSIEIADQKRKLGFLSKRKHFLTSKSKEGKRANQIYFYEI